MKGMLIHFGKNTTTHCGFSKTTTTHCDFGKTTTIPTMHRVNNSCIKLASSDLQVVKLQHVKANQRQPIIIKNPNKTNRMQ